MKLFKTESPFLEKHEWRKLLLATSIMVLVLYVVAMVFSLCGSDIFIVKYQNEQMDRIESFLRQNGIYSIAMWIFATIEFAIISSFVLMKRTRWYYVIPYLVIPIGIAFLRLGLPTAFYTVLTLVLYVVMLAVDSFALNKDNKWKKFGFGMIRLAISQVVSYGLQLMIYVIKAGYFDNSTHIMTLSAQFIYSIELDIALSVILFTIALYIDKGKGDSQQWTTYQAQSGFSQTSKTRSQRLFLKKLTKTQRNKLIWLYVRLYLIQILGFAIIMILPFLLGKVFEFLVMYLAFAIARYILGFKYSLHFKNEMLCITVGAVVFGILTLAVPFFYVEVIMAVLLGVGLAIFLHFSYKYRGWWLFAKMAKPDKFATLYVIFEGDLSENHILRTCKYKGLDDETSKIVFEYMEGYKLSYLAFRFNYSTKTMDRKLSDAIDILNK